VYHAEAPPGSVGVREYLSLLRRRKLVVLAGLVLGLLVVSGYHASRPHTFQATALIAVRPVLSDPFTQVGSGLDKQVSMPTERSLAASATVAAAAGPKLSPPVPTWELSRDLSVTVVPDTMVLSFAYTGSSATLAAERANALAEAYLETRQQRMAATVKVTLTSLAQRADDLQAQLATLGKERAVAKTDSDRAAIDAQVDVYTTALVQVQQQQSSASSIDTTPGYVNQPAVPPTTAAGLRASRLLPMGALVGLIVGILAAIAWEGLSRPRPAPAPAMTREGGGIERAVDGYPPAPESERERLPVDSGW
jgi:polysaccharide biosynthesis transport protein